MWKVFTIVNLSLIVNELLKERIITFTLEKQIHCRSENTHLKGHSFLYLCTVLVSVEHENCIAEHIDSITVSKNLALIIFIARLLKNEYTDKQFLFVIPFVPYSHIRVVHVGVSGY